jgi:hypothetical protein
MADSPTEPSSPRRGPLQGRRGIAIIAGGVALFVALAVAAILGVLALGLGSGFSGCSAADERPIPTLERLSILRQAPDDAQFRRLNSGCDGDDQFAFAEADYFYDGDRAVAVAFYKKTAAADGWKLKTENTNPSVRPDELAIDTDSLCFTKDLGGYTAYLSLAFQRDIPIDAPDTNDYWWGVRANGMWC